MNILKTVVECSEVRDFPCAGQGAKRREWHSLCKFCNAAMCTVVV
jgi:hypothetical protein